MSVIIQGLKLPAYQGEHKESDRYGWFLTVYKTGKVELHIFEKDFDVKDIPTPHGRLIDADEIFCEIDGIKGWDYGDESDMAISAAEALSAIDDSPTVIEAEVSE